MMYRGGRISRFPRPYERATLFFLSGMAATDLATGESAHGTVAAETRQTLTNMGELLEASGSSLAKVVKVNVLIYSMLEYENMNSAYREFSQAILPPGPRVGPG